MQRALICGIGGQDGSYLAELLLAKGYEVWGTSRDAQSASLSNLQALGIVDKVKVLSMAPNDFRSVFQAVERSDPQEIYNLSGQSSVGLSFEQPAETLESIVTGVLNLLEVARLRSKVVQIYQAGSSECFGDTGDTAATEKTPFQPRSPYAVAKASAHWLVANYREAYGLQCYTGILFNHESPLRPQRFVTRKIIAGAHRIASGDTGKLTLGNLDIARDWGWAPEYVEAMWRMLQTDAPGDYLIATGHTTALRDFVAAAFAHFDLDWQEHVDLSQEFSRPSDIRTSRADPSRAADLLGWTAKTHMKDVVRKMCEAEAKRG
ncbi:GDP-mannose 4,6-dehydratase [Sulfitobacter sp. SK012]|uniref:GDP-mannose 4,6-dehydratase n=1 Tax=Sulfitobacter sp. SK012 TaxID=1389005 RepID=UPI000E0AEBFD|nr:GDP-mannose 4,6-dehydratase [Sulfitobacter sp. SK012]AXI44592.1 GDP-mannose 4,6-dehydratase [Sulfitobacter sp. SK012]